jgi:hypothetical protein
LSPFSTELLRDRHLMTSRLDSLFAGYPTGAGANNTSFDYSNSNRKLFPHRLPGLRPQ